MRKASAFSLMSAAAGRIEGAVVAVRIVRIIRREKFRNGESDSSEGITGVFCVAGAFFFGHTEIICRDKHLNISFKLYD